MRISWGHFVTVPANGDHFVALEIRGLFVALVSEVQIISGDHTFLVAIVVVIL